MRGTWGSFLALGVLFCTEVASAETFEVYNDDWSSGELLGWQQGFVPDEAAAVALTPLGVGPWNIDYVYFPFGGADEQKEVWIEVYEESDAGTSANDPPGEKLFEGLYTATGSSMMAAAFNIAHENIQVTGPFRLAIRFTSFNEEGLPSIARDNGGRDHSSANFIHLDNGTWVRSSVFSVPGDWIIRAGITDIGNGGMVPELPPASDEPGEEEEGGGCNAGGSGADYGLLLLAIAFWIRKGFGRREK